MKLRRVSAAEVEAEAEAAAETGLVCSHLARGWVWVWRKGRRQEEMWEEEQEQGPPPR